MGHGTHWGAVLTNLEEDFAAAMDLGIQKGAVVGTRHHEVWSGPLGELAADMTLIQGAQSGFGILGVVVSADSKTYLHSAFPVAATGIVHRVRVLEIHESSFGLEASITAEIGDARINFFEPDYALQSELYQPGAELDVSLAEIAYVLSVLEHGSARLLPIEQPPPSTLPANGFGLAYVQSEQDGPGLDDYRFRGLVKEVESVEFFDRPALRLTTTVLRLEDGERDIDIDLYVLDDKISEGKTPTVGGDVSGVLWLQGIAQAPKG